MLESRNLRHAWVDDRNSPPSFGVYIERLTDQPIVVETVTAAMALQNILPERFYGWLIEALVAKRIVRFRMRTWNDPLSVMCFDVRAARHTFFAAAINSMARAADMEERLGATDPPRTRDHLIKAAMRRLLE